MKSTRALVILLFTALLTTPASAQTIGIGVRAGYNLAFANRGGDTSGSIKDGLMFGASAVLELFPAFALQGGVQYVQKNNRFELTLPGGATTTENYQFDYLELPLSMSLDLGSGSPRIYLLLGTTLGTVLKATGGNTGEGETDTTDVSSSIDPVDMSIDIGGGMALDLGSHATFVVEAKYNYGLFDVYNYGAQIPTQIPSGGLPSMSSWRARDLKLVAGLYFSL